MVTWLSYPHMSVWTFLPWLLLLTDRLVRRPSLLAGAGLAAVVGLQFLSGHAESSFHVAAGHGRLLRAAAVAGARATGRPGRCARSLAFGGAVGAAARRWPRSA